MVFERYRHDGNTTIREYGSNHIINCVMVWPVLFCDCQPVRKSTVVVTGYMLSHGITVVL